MRFLDELDISFGDALPWTRIGPYISRLILPSDWAASTTITSGSRVGEGVNVGSGEEVAERVAVWAAVETIGG